MTLDRSLRRGSGDPELDRRLTALLADTGADAHRDLLMEMLAAVVGMGRDGLDRLDMKITSAALREMREAFRVFSPYRSVPKVTIFGSARTLPDDPRYVQTRAFASALAAAGWMVVTGAGPGIMAAGAEGAGRARSLGVNIRLPFEQEANAHIAADPKLVVMKYFFTRKLMLMKESAGFAVLPGGFGTLDETFELLTLLQTGKAAPAPLVLLEVPGDRYWRAFDSLVRDELVARGLVDPEDPALYRITDDVGTAVGEILGFFRNYHSGRYVGEKLVLRLRAAPTEDEIASLNEQFADICVGGRIKASGPLPPEVSSGDHPDLPRLVLPFDRMSHGRLRLLINAINSLPSAPPAAAPDVDAVEAAGLPPLSADDDPAATVPRELEALLARVADVDDPEHQQLAALQVGLVLRLARGGPQAPDRNDRLLLPDELRSLSLDGGAQRAVLVELARLAPRAQPGAARGAMVTALGSGPPALAVDLALELLDERGGEWPADDVRHLLRTIGGLLGPGRDEAEPEVVAALAGFRPPPVLAELGRSDDPAVAAAALRLLKAAGGEADATHGGRHGWRQEGPPAR